MPATMTTAKSEILTLVKAAFDGGSESPVKVLWPDTTGSRPTTADYWASVVLRTVSSIQTSLAGRYTNYGLLLISLYYPGGDGQTVLSTLAQEMVDAIRGQHTAGGVWFRGVTPQEGEADGPWHKYTVSAEYEYDQF